jgi:hypothetical protein
MSDEATVLCVRCQRRHQRPDLLRCQIEPAGGEAFEVPVCVPCSTRPIPKVLAFLGIKPALADGVHATGSRCDCSARANLRAVVVHGVVVDAGCPVCGQQVPCELVEGGVGFFPTNTVIL